MFRKLQELLPFLIADLILGVVADIADFIMMSARYVKVELPKPSFDR